MVPAMHSSEHNTVGFASLHPYMRCPSCQPTTRLPLATSYQPKPQAPGYRNVSGWPYAVAAALLGPEPVLAFPSPIHIQVTTLSALLATLGLHGYPRSSRLISGQSVLMLRHLQVPQGCIAVASRIISHGTSAAMRKVLLLMTVDEIAPARSPHSGCSPCPCTGTCPCPLWALASCSFCTVQIEPHPPLKMLKELAITSSS